MPSSSDSIRSTGYALAKYALENGSVATRYLTLHGAPAMFDPGLAEVDLHRRAGPHATVHEGLLQPDRRPQPGDVAAHRARGDRSGHRQQQPANPFRGPTAAPRPATA